MYQTPQATSAPVYVAVPAQPGQPAFADRTQATNGWHTLALVFSWINIVVLGLAVGITFVFMFLMPLAIILFIVFVLVLIIEIWCLSILNRKKNLGGLTIYRCIIFVLNFFNLFSNTQKASQTVLSIIYAGFMFISVYFSHKFYDNKE
ncbi:hypothetical protein PCE1_003082 [Barthelona sp. PCE]